MWGQGYANKKAVKFIQKHHLVEGVDRKKSTHDSKNIRKKNSQGDETIASCSSISLASQRSSTSSKNNSKQKKGLFSSMKKTNDTNVSSPTPSSVSTRNLQTPKDKVDVLSFEEKRAHEALKHIKATIGIQEAREEEMENKIKDVMKVAKEKLEAGNQRAAIRSMKKAKLYQAEMNMVAGAIETLEMQTMSIESSLYNMEVIKAMQEGSDALKNMQSGTKVEDVDIAIDEIRNAMDYTSEINDILTRPVDDIIIDDDELLKELAAYNGQFKSTNVQLDLPNVPTSPLKGNEGKDGEEERGGEKKTSGFLVGW